MSVIRFSDSFMKSVPFDSFKFVESGLVEHSVQYVLNSKYRKAVGLKKWLKEQLSLGSVELVKCDDVVIETLGSVIDGIRYTSDAEQWSIPEYWQTASETIQKKRGDCEDGAVLLYVLLRNLGVPAERLLLFAGDVEDPGDKTKVVGHCALFYRPDNYPLNFAILDWCFYKTKKSIGVRNLYTVSGKEIFGYVRRGDTWAQTENKYKRGWFWFNENKSTLFLRSE